MISGERTNIASVEEQRFPRDVPPLREVPWAFGPENAPPRTGETASESLARTRFTPPQRPDAVAASPGSPSVEAGPTPLVAQPSAPDSAEGVKSGEPETGHRWNSTGTLVGVEVGYCQCGFPVEADQSACSQAGRRVSFFDRYLRHLPKRGSP